MIRCTTMILASLLFFLQGYSQNTSVPADSIQLKNTKGKLVYYGDLVRKDPVVLVCFWSIGNEASINELNAIAKQYDNWNKLARFRLLPVCIDEGQQTNRMRPLSNENGWNFEVFADLNMDLQHLLGFSSAPQSMILQKGQVVFQQSGFTEGSENYLFNKILAISPASPRPLR